MTIFEKIKVSVSGKTFGPIPIPKLGLVLGSQYHNLVSVVQHSGERATGYGVAFLNTLFGQFSNSKLLKDSRALTGSNVKK